MKKLVGGICILLLIAVFLFLIVKQLDQRARITVETNDASPVDLNPPVMEIPPQEAFNVAFGNQERVYIEGYDDDVMEVGLSKEGNYLLFNDDGRNKDLHWAERVDDTHFVYRGKIDSVNTKTIDGTPSFDLENNVYYTSLVDYPATMKSMHVGKFMNGKIVNPLHIEGDIYTREKQWISLDPDISPDGNTLTYSLGLFDGGPMPKVFDVRLAYKTKGVFLINEDATKNINTDNLEYAPTLSADGKELFFTRITLADGKPVQNGIYVARREYVTESFGIPEKINAISGGFVEAPSISLDGRSLYYHKEEDGIYVAYRVTR